ncbi:phosphatase PAP2 family protein [Nakamurella aerolata]|uniref:phosphatase PAP2 family protein n=1 Tax=Nakamurella aerolata TaxID=1656892 RepID=UPI001BB28CCE
MSGAGRRLVRTVAPDRFDPRWRIAGRGNWLAAATRQTTRRLRGAPTTPTPVDRGLRALTTSANHGLLWFGVAGALAATGKRGRRAALRGITSLAEASLLSNTVIKPLVGRRRPAADRVNRLRQIGKQPWTSSFPSGHAASAAAFATGAAVEWPATAAVLAPLAGAVSYSRVHVGVHYPSDVVTGAAIGAGIAVLGAKIWPAKPFAPAEMPDATAPPLLDGAGLLLLINSASGTASGAEQAITELLPKTRVVRWDPSEHGVADALDAALDGPDGASVRALGVAGGDGTVASVAQVALDRGLPLAVLPAGTLNHFAGALALDTHADTAAALRDGRAGAVTVAELNDKLFLNTAGLGGYPELVERRDRLSHRIGKWPAAAVALWRTARKHQPMTVTINGERVPVWAMFIGNGRYSPRGLAPAWRERLDDGVLDAQFLRADRRFSTTIGVLASLIGLVERTRVYGTVQAPALTIDVAGDPVPAAHDGEVTNPGSAFRLRVLPKTLTVYHG